jgi:hypothetical protein
MTKEPRPQLEETPITEPEPLMPPPVDVPAVEKDKINKKIEDLTTELDLDHDDQRSGDRAD